MIHIPDEITLHFPHDPDLKPLNAVSYMAMPLFNNNKNTVIGHLAILDTKPMPKRPRYEELFRIFAARAGAELRRIRAEREAREKQEQLSRLFESALDAILELDNQLKVIRGNCAAERTFKISREELSGIPLQDILDTAGVGKIRMLIKSQNDNTRTSSGSWIPGGLNAINGDGELFPVEGSLSQYEHNGNTFHTLILRDVNEKLAAEHRIHSLQSQTEYLRAELDAVHNFRQIIGTSPALTAALKSVRQVAGTDATVLIHGETGTGKELIARAVHDESRRSEQPLIKVNCAAIPSTLIESEFFGHAKGAFTGATEKREGRFALADGGTIFLDEIGELPLDVQAKLLRVIQEGEFEPVGSSKTCRVDVRIIAATNRDLLHASADGTFREDLYYRLNVFPIVVPPLRDRGDDIILLAEAFAKSFSQKIGRPAAALSHTCRECLMAYSWPGNVRELQNVIERAVIIAHDGILNVAEILPQTMPPAGHTADANGHESNAPILTIDQMRDMEIRNIRRALDTAQWKISGPDGAAALLGIPPSTLASRMKALDISRSA